MPSNDDSANTKSLAEDANLSPTPTTGLSDPQTTNLYGGMEDPNAAALNNNAEAAQMRQLTGEPPGSELAPDGGELPAAQSAEFEDGT